MKKVYQEEGNLLSQLILLKIKKKELKPEISTQKNKKKTKNHKTYNQKKKKNEM